MKKKASLVVSIIVGAAIFLFLLERTGFSSIGEIFMSLNWTYMSIYFALSTLTFVPTVLRWKVILKGYGKDVPFLMLLKQTIAGFSISYITPAVRIGGEPLRAYMLKKEANVDYRSGSSSIIMDKFVELIGTVIFGVFGLILLILIPGVHILFKVILATVILFAFYGLSLIYYRTITNRGSFSTVFNFFRLYKINKIKNFVKVLEDIEKRLKKFFVKNKKEFLKSFIYYLIFGVLLVLEFKFLLLGLGVNASLVTVILALTVLGFVNFIPVPAALGFLEAGQSSLFHAVMGRGSVGFVLSLVVRIRNLFFVAIGFGLISYFSSKEVQKKFLSKK